MAGMGPPPKAADKRARANATPGTRQLPAEGRKGQQPGWPLVADVTLSALRDSARERLRQAREDMEGLEGPQAARARRELAPLEDRYAMLAAQAKAQRTRERTLWAALWKTPQACAWEQLGWTRDVAMYVRHTVLGELGDLKHAQEARQWSDRLGLSPMSLLRLRWEIAADEVAAQRDAAPVATGARARRAARTLVAVGE